MQAVADEPRLGTLLLAMLPVAELRGAIPWATFIFKIPWYDALIWSVLGNLLPVPVILLGLEPVERYLSRWTHFRMFFAWLDRRARTKSRVVERYEAIGLMIFVGIPLPGTGAWTGCLVARLFGIRFTPALAAISGGVAIAGIVVTLASQGVLGFWSLTGFSEPR